MIRTNSLLPVLGCLVLALLVGLGAGYLARERALDALLVSGEADARIRQALIESEVARYRLLPLALADDRDVIAAERGESDAAVAVLNGKLKDLAQTTGASAIYVVNRAGRAIAASNWDKPYSFVGSNYSFRRYIREAQNSGAGRQFALGTVSRKPGLYLAQRTRGGGAVVVKLEFDWIEDQWRQAGGITFVTNPMGVIFVTSRPAWRFAATRELNAQERAQTQRDSGANAIHPRPWDQRRDGLLEVPGREGPFVRIDTPGGNEGWQLFLLLPAKGAVAGQARLVGVTAGGGALVVSLFVLWLLLRSRRRRARTLELESAVVARTAQLREEMEQRAQVESRAAQLREELRLANRLATLGQVSASVAHETAQPVSAIRNYAANAKVFLERGDSEQVAENLGAIDRLAERIGVVTAQLRGFARKKTVGGTQCALGEVLEGAELLLRDRLVGVDAVIPDLSADLLVTGDKVRGEQILVNLLQNALDALGGHLTPRADPRIVIEVAVDRPRGQVAVVVRDNGPGISDEVAEKLFTPFATSREEGLGLGLVIAQDIAAEFGGSLRCMMARGALPSAQGQGGAAFELILRIAR